MAMGLLPEKVLFVTLEAPVTCPGCSPFLGVALTLRGPSLSMS